MGHTPELAWKHDMGATGIIWEHFSALFPAANRDKRGVFFSMPPIVLE